MEQVRICFVGLDNLPMLAPEYRHSVIGGESVQQTLLATAMARRGHRVSMVVADHGQADGASWRGVRAFKAYGFDDGIPVLRFLHPRWTGLWSALKRADAELYYTSCAGAQVGLLSMFCQRHRKRFVFRTASDSDCDPSRLLVRFARDRWLYAYGLRRADAILVQGDSQACALAHNFGLTGRVAGMLVAPAGEVGARDIDVLWVSNVRRVKRPDRLLALAANLPQASIHIVGGPLPGEEALYRDVERAAQAFPSITFHGRLPYGETHDLYGRAKILVNTSDIEGFPNSYLQAWIHGVPVVALIDPDGVISRHGLGVAVPSQDNLLRAVADLLRRPEALRAAGERCRAFMAREYAEDKVLGPYLAAFDEALRYSVAGSRAIASGDVRHV
jgi:glycosyltransferase involved in cell wall biosynthesis